VLLAGAAAAQHPGRYLESRRAAAPVVYLATVFEVREVAPADAPNSAARMEATLQVGKLFRPATPASPAPAEAVVRYEQAPAAPPRGAPLAEDLPTGVLYRLKAGDRAVVFAGSFDKAFPLEMITGPAKTVSTQVSALRAWLLAMDDVTATLHGVTPAIRAQQVALYDRILADLR
jgi:anti-sigma-K factor RskA